MNSPLPNLVTRVFVSRTTQAGFRNEDAEYESVPYPELQEEAPDSNPDGRALEAKPDRLEVEDFHGVLVRVDLTNWEIRLIYVIALLAISSICRWTDSIISECLKYNVKNQE